MPSSPNWLSKGRALALSLKLNSLAVSLVSPSGIPLSTGDSYSASRFLGAIFCSANVLLTFLNCWISFLASSRLRCRLKRADPSPF